MSHVLPQSRSRRRLPCRALLASVLAALPAQGCSSRAEPVRPPDPVRDTVAIPLSEMGSRTYRGSAGGLYPGGSQVPAPHAAAGVERARRIQPRDAAGNPSPGGRYALLSIGMSNTTQEFCSGSSSTPCDPWSFMAMAAADPAVNRAALVLVNGAAGGQVAESWDSPADPNYDRVRDTRLAPLGLTERQVQVVWLKVARPGPTTTLPAADAEAYALQRVMGDILRTLRVRYPNLQQVFVSSRIYAGYATTRLNPEPYAYESGFAVKWLVQAQIDQAREGRIVDARAGDLGYDGAAPWVAWGPYLWGAGPAPRADGLVWLPADFQADGTHPSPSGARKVALLLLDFFKNSPFTRCWFLAGETC